ncbi:MAG: hypothetical protein WAU41_03060 [Gaiellaceae bacterium]
MAYRTRRAFRAQYELLLAASVFEEASARLEAPAGALGRPFRRRLERDVERRRAVFSSRLVEFRSETLHRLAPSDLLPDIDQLLLAHAGHTASARPLERSTSPFTAAALGKPTAYVAAAAWAATVDELATRGITNRPSLIIAELTALALTPIALFWSPERGDPDDTRR